ncbi:hypothetical protein LT493_08365 [Streptomyces tricolor]|nr:hypothetical protein [Streptomyces tricolor]
MTTAAVARRRRRAGPVLLLVQARVKRAPSGLGVAFGPSAGRAGAGPSTATSASARAEHAYARPGGRLELPAERTRHHRDASRRRVPGRPLRHREGEFAVSVDDAERGAALLNAVARRTVDHRSSGRAPVKGSSESAGRARRSRKERRKRAGDGQTWGTRAHFHGHCARGRRRSTHPCPSLTTEPDAVPRRRGAARYRGTPSADRRHRPRRPLAGTRGRRWRPRSRGDRPRPGLQ